MGMCAGRQVSAVRGSVSLAVSWDVQAGLSSLTLSLMYLVTMTKGLHLSQQGPQAPTSLRDYTEEMVLDNMQ